MRRASADQACDLLRRGGVTETSSSVPFEEAPPSAAMVSAPVVLDARPRVEVACNALVQTDNKLFNKVIIVFAYLCEEAATMRDHARNNLVPALLLLAEQPTTAHFQRRRAVFTFLCYHLEFCAKATLLA